MQKSPLIQDMICHLKRGRSDRENRTTGRKLCASGGAHCSTQLASSSDATGLSGGDVQSSVRQDLLDSDACALESTLQSGLVAPWMRFRCASPVSAPRIHFCIEQPEDIQALAQTLSTLSAAGLEAADVEEVSARIGVKLQRKPIQEVPSGFMHSDGLRLSAEDQYPAQTGKGLGDALEEWMGPVADAVSVLDDDSLSDEVFAAKLKHCGELKFGDSGAFEKLETADMEDAYGIADKTRNR